MRKASALLGALAAMLTLHIGGVLAQEASQSTGADDYIVVLNDNVDNPSQAASGMEQQQDAEVGFVYRHALEGFSATIPDENLEAVLANPQVDYIERDSIAFAEAQVLPWGINRVDADESSTRAGDGAGTVLNVNAYIIDSGIDRNHADLNVVDHINFVDDGQDNDCDGHGTHVAGTLAAEDNAIDVVGVSPGVSLTGIKVLGCNGTGPLSGVIKGVDWVTANAKEPAIANMSLGSGPNPSQALDDAIRRSAESGVFYSVAAGNKGEDACLHSPARAGAGTDNGIMTVAGTNEGNQEMPISNYGSCVDIWAPGAKILSTRLGGGTTIMGGTSMAAPHVGGGAGLYLSSHIGASSSAVEAALKDAAVSPGTNSKDGRAILLENVGRLTIDSTAPETTVDPDPTGTINSRTASFGFTSSEAGSNFTCSLDGAGFESCVSPQEYSDLADGPHTFEVRATDAAGNTDPTPAKHNFVVDATEPMVSCGTADGGWHKDDVTIYCTASDEVSGLADTADASFSLTTSVAEGIETDDASTGSRLVADAAGNTVTAGPIIGIKIDKKSPTYDCGDVDTAWSATDKSYTCTASDGGSGLSAAQESVTPASFNLSTSVAAETEDSNASTGSKDLYDAVGNRATAGPISGNHVDKKVPNTTAEAGTYAGGWTNQNVTITLSARDGGSGVKETEYSIDGGAYQPYESGGISVSSDGDHTISYRSTDNVNNTESAKTLSVWVDKNAPPVPVINDPAEGSFDTDGIITLSGIAEANSTVEVFDGTASKVSRGSTMANSSGAWSKTLSGVSEGSHTYTAKAKDAAGNTSDFSDARIVIVDAINPRVLDPTSPLTGATGVAPGTNVIVTFSEAMNASTLRNATTLRSTTFTLLKRNSDGTRTAVAAKVSYTETTTSTGTNVYRAILNPDSNLQLGATYIATVTTGARDVANNPLDQDPNTEGKQPKRWTFTTRK